MRQYQAQRIFIALIWLVNGLVCKILNLVPRHQEIVASILGVDHAPLLTKLIGVSEVCMTVWILAGLSRKLNVITQLVVIAVMNALEFFLVPELLLWGKFNSVFAALLIAFIYYNEFILHPKLTASHGN